jgi:hypothetical protein
LAEALAAIPCRSAIIDAELCLLGAGGVPDFYGLSAAMRRGGDLAIYAFDLLHRDGRDLRPLPLVEHRRRLRRLLARSTVQCLCLVEAFEDGARLIEQAERHGLKGVVSKRKASLYRSGPSRDWRKIKTRTWSEANRTPHLSASAFFVHLSRFFPSVVVDIGSGVQAGRGQGPVKDGYRPRLRRPSALTAPAFVVANHFDGDLRQRLSRLIAGAVTLRITQRRFSSP